MASTKPANKIQLNGFRQILTWPFVISNDYAKDHTTTQWYKCCNDLLRADVSEWRHVKPEQLKELLPPQTVKGGGKIGFYEEAVYFHNFIRDQLYNPDEEEAIVYQHNSLNRIVFDIGLNEPSNFSFDVPFTSLHVYKTGVAILTVELKLVGKTIDLSTAQTLTDMIRRAYPPYWIGKNQPGGSPKGATLFHKTDNTSKANLGKVDCKLTRLSDRDSAEHALIEDNLREPLFSWWREILSPLMVEGNDTNGSIPLLRQVLDERIPVMTTLSVAPIPDKCTALLSISDGDWFRIAGADMSGTDKYPYNPRFLKTQYNDIFYDRFMPDKMGNISEATRFALAGYHFAAVGSGDFFENFITEHVRRHYRQMQHLCLLEFATLLSISQTLCNAVDRRQSEQAKTSDANFREAILETQKNFMDFTHKYHFTGVSNQLQARELFDKFRASMELDARYAEIKAELTSATDLALSQEQREATAAAENLTEVATTAAVIGVAATLTGMNVIFDEEKELFALLQWLSGGNCAGMAFDTMLFGLTLFLIGIGAGAMFGKRLGERVKRDLCVICAVAVVLFLAGLGAARMAPPDCTAEIVTFTKDTATQSAAIEPPKASGGISKQTVFNCSGGP